MNVKVSAPKIAIDSMKQFQRTETFVTILGALPKVKGQETPFRAKKNRQVIPTGFEQHAAPTPGQPQDR